MPHKIGDTESIKTTKESIGYYENLIVQIKAVQRGDSNSVKMGMEAIRELEFDAGYKKDQHLESGEPARAVKAHGCQQMQKAYQNVIMMFESPNTMIDTYKEEIERLQAYVDRYEPKQPNTKQQES